MEVCKGRTWRGRAAGVELDRIGKREEKQRLFRYVLVPTFLKPYSPVSSFFFKQESDSRNWSTPGRLA